MINLVGLGLSSLKTKQLGNPDAVQHMDLSSNNFDSGQEFAAFKNIKTLVLDDNQLSSLDSFPIFKNLETFSANKNNFSDIDKFLDDAFDKFGNLKNLSLLKNPLNPFFEDEKKYAIYRDKVLEKFPKLKTLDGCAIEFIKKSMLEEKKAEEQKFERLQVTAVIDEKYKKDTVVSVKTKSEGNRFLRNNQL